MKGAIAEISGTKAIMLTDDGEFVTIKNKKYSVGQRVAVVKRSYSSLSAIAACFLFVFMLGGGVWGYYTPVSYVDIDINPSIRLKLNILDHIIGITPLNDDGKAFLKKAGELPENIDECVNEITQQAIVQGYINEDNTEVYMYSVSSKKEIPEKLNRCAKILSEKENVNVYTDSESEEAFETAKKYSSSVGRIKLVEEYGELAGGTLDENVKAFKDKPNKKIREAIKEHKKQDEALKQDAGAEWEKYSDNANKLRKQADIECGKPEKKNLNASSDKHKEQQALRQPEKSVDISPVRSEITEIPEKKTDSNHEPSEYKNGEKNEQIPQKCGISEARPNEEKTMPDKNPEMYEGIKREEDGNIKQKDSNIHTSP